MTSENRCLISVDEIIAFDFRCLGPGCGAKIAIRLDADQRLPEECPLCKTRWFDIRTETASAHEAMAQMKSALRRFSQVRDRLGCSFSLEVKPSDSQG